MNCNSASYTRYVNPFYALCAMFKTADKIQKNTMDEFIKNCIETNHLYCECTSNGEKKTIDVTYNEKLKNTKDSLKETFLSDGTLAFELDSVVKVVRKAIDISVTNDCKVSIGEISILHEESNGTEEKPWMRSKVTVEMPYKIYK